MTREELASIHIGDYVVVRDQHRPSLNGCSVRVVAIDVRIEGDECVTVRSDNGDDTKIHIAFVEQIETAATVA